jgi:hypothetical protein
MALKIMVVHSKIIFKAEKTLPILFSFEITPTVNRPLQPGVNKGDFDPLKTESESYVTTHGQSASLSWNKAPIWGLRPDIY